mmetsp:Transcript_46379/g.148625  ORF Transcript_46379/g.148625 Transcript_46379/m.148625 type:complete len:734 (+) Transcript_46379:46-2247(+)
MRATLLVALLACLNGARGETYYLDPGGSDSASGLSPDSAWKTLDRALQAIPSLKGPSTFYLAGGSYGRFYPDLEVLAGRSEEQWVTFAASEPSVVFECIYLLKRGDVFLTFEGITVGATCPGNSNENNAVNLVEAGRVTLSYVRIEPPESHAPWSSYTSIPHGVHTRKSTHIEILNTTIVGGRYGVILWGTHLKLQGCDIGFQFGDAVRIVSAEGVLVAHNRIHHVADYQATGEHLDAIQFFAAGPAGANPQPRDVALVGNLITDMPGQMIFVQSNYVDDIGYIENLVIEGNILGPKTMADASIPVQLQGAKNFSFQGNTVYGKVLVRDSSTGAVESNLIGGLQISSGSSLSSLDHNVYGSLITSGAGELSPGPNNAVEDVLYRDVAANDYEPLSEVACTAGAGGLHAGAVACDPCAWGAAGAEPVALFSTQPPRAGMGEPITLQPAASTACATGAEVSSLSWSLSDGRALSGIGPQHVAFPSPGEYAVTLTVTDTLGGTKSATKAVLVEGAEEVGLVTSYPLDGTLADLSPAGYGDGAWKVAFEGGAAEEAYAPSECGSQALSLCGLGYVELPAAVRDSVNDLEAVTVGAWASRAEGGDGGYVLYKHVTVSLRVDAGKVYCNVGTPSNGWWPEVSAAVEGGTAGWHHYAVSYDGSAVTCYVDGVAVGSKPSEGLVKAGSWAMAIGVNAVKIAFGPEKALPFEGEVSGVRIYSRALAAEEVAAWAGAGACPQL